MFKRVCALITVMVFGGAAHAQATSISAPPEPSLLTFTHSWAAESPLGTLPARVMAADDIELRVWGGFGLGQTRGAIMRRSAGRWLAWSAIVVRCDIKVAIPISDTASAVTRSGYISRARKRCGASIGDTEFSASVYQADTLALEALPSDGIDTVWSNAVAAGVRTLPPRVPRKWRMLDGFSYVIELREGNSYRASAMEAVVEVEADRQAKAVYDAVVGTLAPVRRNREE